MRTIGEAAERLGTTPRQLRYREALGLLPRLPGGRPRGAHRRYGPAEEEAARLGAALEERYGVSPAALAFAVRVLSDPAARADVGRLAALVRPDGQAGALAFEAEKARRLLARG